MPSSPPPSSLRSSAPMPKDAIVPEHMKIKYHAFLNHLGVDGKLPDSCTTTGFFVGLLRGVLKVRHIKRGLVSCSFSVVPGLTNYYEGLHGGALAAVAERMATACARTVVTEDKEIFMSELSLSYLSAAPVNAELIAEASAVKSGRNMTAISLEFKLKETAKLCYMAHAVFFNSPVAKL